MSFSRHITVGMVAAFLVTMSGCAVYTPSAKPSDAPTAANAYLYGQFKIQTATALINIGFYRTAGLSFVCASGQKLLVKLKVEDPIQVIPVTPASNCSLREIVYVESDGFIKGRQPPPAGWVTEVEFAAGKATYIGDFSAQASSSQEGRNVSVNWTIHRPTNNYAATTVQMKKAFPAFASMPTENRSLMR